MRFFSTSEGINGVCLPHFGCSKRSQDYAAYMSLCIWRKPLEYIDFMATIRALIDIIWHAA